MKRKKMELNKKLSLNKETITNLTPDHQAGFMGGEKPTYAACGTTSKWHSLCKCEPTKNGDCTGGTACCPISSFNLPCGAL